MAESSIYDSIVQESVGGMTRRVYSCDMRVGKRTRQESEQCGPPRPRNKPGPKPKLKPKPKPEETPKYEEMSLAFVGESQLICLLAVERRENEALRRYTDWLTKRIQTLEKQISGAEIGGTPDTCR